MEVILLIVVGVPIAALALGVICAFILSSQISRMEERGEWGPK